MGHTKKVYESDQAGGDRAGSGNKVNQSPESSPSLVAGFAVSLATRVSPACSPFGLEKLEKWGELLPTRRSNQIISAQQISHVARVRGGEVA